MWDLYATSLLTPETKLTGRHRPSERKANTAAVLDLIGDANYDERKRRERQGMGMRGVPAATRPQHHGPRPPQQGHGPGPRQHGRPQQPAHGVGARPPHEPIAPAHRP